MEDFGNYQTMMFFCTSNPSELHYFITTDDFELKGPVNYCKYSHNYRDSYHVPNPRVWQKQDISIDYLIKVDFDKRGRITYMSQRSGGFKESETQLLKRQYYFYSNDRLQSCISTFISWYDDWNSEKTKVHHEFKSEFSYDVKGMVDTIITSGKGFQTTVVSIDRTDASCPVAKYLVTNAKGKKETDMTFSARHTLSDDGQFTITANVNFLFCLGQGKSKMKWLNSQREIVAFAKEGKMLHHQLFDGERIIQSNSYEYLDDGRTRERCCNYSEYNWQGDGLCYFSYNKQGDLILIDRRAPSVSKTEIEYEYDSYGNWVSKTITVDGRPYVSHTREIIYY